MSIFEKIVAGELPCHRVWENEEFLAFLDIRPLAKGHCLVIPKQKIDPLFSMNPEQLGRFVQAAQRVAKILESKIPCERVCMAVIGFEVPHAHIHLIPAQSMKDFPWPGGKMAPESELKDLAALLRAE
jgi:histidine triad (HIT) family protein